MRIWTQTAGTELVTDCFHLGIITSEIDAFTRERWLSFPETNALPGSPTPSCCKKTLLKAFGATRSLNPSLALGFVPGRSPSPARLQQEWGRHRDPQQKSNQGATAQSGQACQVPGTPFPWKILQFRNSFSFSPVPDKGTWAEQKNRPCFHGAPQVWPAAALIYGQHWEKTHTTFKYRCSSPNPYNHASN